MGINGIEKLKPTPDEVCYHEWKYQQMTFDVLKYCTKCDEELHIHSRLEV